MSNKFRGVSVKIQLYVALVVMIMFSQLVSYIAYSLDPGALVLYQPDFWKRGIYGLIISILMTTILFLMPYSFIHWLFNWLGKLRNIWLFFTIIPLAYLLTPFAQSRYGARRWLFGVQISDIAKFVALIFIVFSLEAIWNRAKYTNFSLDYEPIGEQLLHWIVIIIFLVSFALSNQVGFGLSFTTLLIYVVIILFSETLLNGRYFLEMALWFAVIYILILAEPDISTSSLFAIWFLFMLMLWYGKRGIHISLTVMIGIVTFTLLLRADHVYTVLPSMFHHAIDRLLVWKDPFIDPNGISYHVVKNYLAVYKGGMWGIYPVNMSYIPPVPWSDAILPFTAITLGILFEFLLVFLWIGWGMFFLISGMRIRNREGMYITGFALWFILQTIFNMLSTYDVFPPTGISVPFLSWGRTGLIVFTFMNGLAAIFVAENLEGRTVQ